VYLSVEGETQYFDVRISPLVDKNGKNIGFISTSNNITERKQAEKKLQESEEKYRTLIETSPDGVSVTDLEGKFIYVNQRIADMLGYLNVNDLIGTYSIERVVSEDRNKL